MTSKAKRWLARIAVVITLAFGAYMGGAVTNQVTATTETTTAEAAPCENDRCSGGWLFGVCRNRPSSNQGCDMVWLLGCRTYECGEPHGTP